METSQYEKTNLRKKAKQLRNSLTLQEIKDKSFSIFNNLKPILDKSATNIFFVYNSFGSEVDTSLIINYLLSQDKKVFCPRVEGEHMVAVRLDENTQFVKSKFGILEPLGKSENINNFNAIIPALAIDKYGNRLGYGGGYYDKFLNNKICYKIAIVYDFQLIEKIHTNNFDQSMDMLITENNVKIFDHKTNNLLNQ